MPTATFSRKKSKKRQASSDIEEEPSHSRTEEQVEDDENDPRNRRRAANGVKREKKPIINTGEGEQFGEDENDEDDDGDDDRIDVDNFSDQPLGRSDVLKLQGFSRDWLAVANEVRPNWSVVGDVAVALADSGEGEEVDKVRPLPFDTMSTHRLVQGLEELDELMKDLIDISAEMQSHETVLDQLAQRIGQGEVLENFVTHYNSGVESWKEKYESMTTRQKYAKNEQYSSFRNNIHEVQHPDTPMPPITEFIAKEIGDDSDDDDELEMGGVSQNYNCPITLTLLDEPLTSEVCKHSFSKNAILQSFRGGDIRCPAAGCTKRFTRSQLKPNKDLAKRVKAYERRVRLAAENDDAEEIID
ncbi:hypothetical protein H0H87_006576 [Tephrocybe sp. NHM501043]|nr:hypothetical protein H0H87_006576 [Tephrocybe sp. NHM501043]